MEDVGCILWPFGIFFPFWYVVPRKNLATLSPALANFLIMIFFVVAKPSRTLLFHERNSEPDRCGILYLCQEHSTNKISYRHWHPIKTNAILDSM
jgi:hypothetical protein